MKKINFKGLNEIMSENELKNILGGSGNGGGCSNGNCGWRGAKKIPCATDWSGSCSGCWSWINSTCPSSADDAWCSE